MSFVLLPRRTTLACFVGVVLLLDAPVQGEEQGQPPERSDPGWTVVQEWSGGPGQRKTEPFVPPSSLPWRVTFKASGDVFGVLNVFVRTTDEELVAAAVSQQARLRRCPPGVPNPCREEALSGSLLVHTEHDEYFLEIASYRLNWQLALEERQ